MANNLKKVAFMNLMEDFKKYGIKAEIEIDDLTLTITGIKLLDNHVLESLIGVTGLYKDLAVTANKKELLIILNFSD